MLGLPALISSIVNMGSTWLNGRALLKKTKLDGQIVLAQAKTVAMVSRMEKQQTADIAWEELSIENSGWKDEWFTILLSIPMILCFIPGGAPYVFDGFTALKQSTPEWYQYAFLVAVASSFGVKKLTDFMSLRKGA